MKRFFYLLLPIITGRHALAQSDTISLCSHKTSSLVFNRLISHTDRGSRDILVQKARGAENILLLKAARDSFPETSLSVITTDGKLKTFIVHFSATPSQLQYTADSSESIFSRMAQQPFFLHRPRQEKFEVALRLAGIYIENDIIYYQLFINNGSPINYDIQSLRFFIRDKRQARRTAAQEIIQTPLLIYDNTNTIAAASSHTLVVALPKFTIPDKKFCYIQLMEKNGGRHLQLKLSNKKLLKAIPFYGRQA